MISLNNSTVPLNGEPSGEGRDEFARRSSTELGCALDLAVFLRLTLAPPTTEDLAHEKELFVEPAGVDGGVDGVEGERREEGRSRRARNAQKTKSAPTSPECA